MKRFKYKGGLVLVLLVGFYFSASQAVAEIGLTIQPLKVSHTMNPGETASGVIEIINASDEAVNVDIKVEDFVPLKGTYNVQFVGRAPGLTTVRDWVTLDAPAQFLLEQGAARQVPYTIIAPSNAEPGGHFGVAFFKASRLPSAGQQLKIGTQVGMLLFVTVPGNALQKGNILEFRGPSFVDKSPIIFNIKFENTGTVHFEPKGKITITNIFGKEIGSAPVEGQVVLPTGVRDLSATAHYKGVLFGRYKAKVQMFDGEGNELNAKSHVFYAFPARYVFGYGAAILAIFFLLKFLKNKLNISISVKK